MDLEKLYYEIKRNIDSLDFSKLWRGFQPLKFALYTNEKCFFNGEYIEKTDAFIANTSIFYNGEWIAIWYVQEPITPVVLTSKIVHEMFHGFQMMHNDKRFPDELEALYQYSYNECNLNSKVKENELLYSLSEKFNQESFEELLQIRKFRLNTFAYEYNYESKIEQIEGSANYVELHCLKQLSYELFEKKLSQMRERIIQPENLFPIRILCYDIGALFLHILKENNIPFEDGFSTDTFSEAIIRNAVPQEYTADSNIKNLLDSYSARASEIISKAREKNVIVSDTPCNLLGVNVYNAVFYKNHIISTYFVMFEDEGKQRIEYGDFVIETNTYKQADKIYRL